MKRTLSLLSVAALSLGSAISYAKDIAITLRPYVSYNESTVVSEVIAPGATLVNSVSGKVVEYNLTALTKIEPPFDIKSGQIIWGVQLSDSYNNGITLEDVIVKDEAAVVLDFSYAMSLGAPSLAEYMVIMFHSQTNLGNDFAEWYSKNEVPIYAKFRGGELYTAYVIDNACDRQSAGMSSTNGGLVFFNESVAPAVLAAEVLPGSDSVPEPTTATLSLLALAGLAMRRRRRA